MTPVFDGMVLGGDIEKPKLEKDPIMDHVEVEYLDLTDEPEEEGWKAPKRPRLDEDEDQVKEKDEKQEL